MISCPFCESELPKEASTADAAALGICSTCFNPVLLSWRSGNEVVEPLPGAHDVRRTAPKDSIAATVLAQAAAGIGDLPMLPEISQQILTLLKDPEFGMADLANLIRRDSVLSLAVMKQANSAAFGGLNEIKDLNGACARLGMKNVAHIVQLTANRNLFITGNTALKSGMERLWRHSVATAQCANDIARASLSPEQDVIFLAGLVHDVGKVLLFEMASSPRHPVVRQLQGNPDLLREVMENLHGLLGLLICQTWKLPPVFRATAYFHDSPEQCPVKEWLSAVHTIALANVIVQIEGYGMYEDAGDAFLASHPSTVYLGLSDIKLASLRVDLSDTLESLFEAAG